MFVSIGKAAKVLGVSTSTMRKWDNEKKLEAEFRTKGGHRRFSMEKLMKRRGKAVSLTEEHTKIVLAYARVSSHKQKEDLGRQINYLTSYSKQQGWEMKKIYQDIASGMNDERNGLTRLLKAIPIDQPYAVVLTYKDRMARFGTALIDLFCDLFGTKIICIKENLVISEEEKLMNDFLALITSFMVDCIGEGGGKTRKRLKNSWIRSKINLRGVTLEKIKD